MSFILAFSIFPVFSSISVIVSFIGVPFFFLYHQSFFSLPICLFSFFYFCLICVYLMCLCVHLCVWMCVRGFPNLSCLSAPQLIESHLFDCTFHNDSLRLKERRNINAITISELKAAKAKRSWSCMTQEWKKDFDGNVFNEKFFVSAFFSTSTSSRDRNFSAFSFRAKIIIADNWSNLNLQNSAGCKKSRQDAQLRARAKKVNRRFSKKPPNNPLELHWLLLA